MKKEYVGCEGCLLKEIECELLRTEQHFEVLVKGIPCPLTGFENKVITQEYGRFGNDFIFNDEFYDARQLAKYIFENGYEFEVTETQEKAYYV